MSFGTGNPARRTNTTTDRSGPLILCAGSMVRHGFTDMVDAAAYAGFDGVSIWKRTCRRALDREAIDLATMRAMLDDRGLVVSEIEGTSAWLPDWAPASPDDLAFDEGLDLAVSLGAPSLLVFADARSIAHDALVDGFATACDRAVERGVDVVIEFLQWSAVPDLPAALQLVLDAGRSNGRIAYDTWHHTRSGAVIPAGLDGSLIGCIQLADGPHEPAEDDPVHETMFTRRPPGEGEFRIDEQLVLLAELGARCPVGVEVYHDDLTALSARELALRLAEAARRVLPPQG